MAEVSLSLANDLQVVNPAGGPLPYPVSDGLFKICNPGR